MRSKSIWMGKELPTIYILCTKENTKETDHTSENSVISAPMPNLKKVLDLLS